MSVQPKWKQKFGQLKEYTERNPEIHIDMSEVSIPKHLRDGFYERFDAIRSAMVDDHYDSLEVDVEALCRNYTRAEREVTELLGLDKIDIPMDLLSFLHKPKEGMIRIIYNRLFEFVQGKLTEEEFERMAANDLAVNATDFFRLGYEPWAALVLIRMLEPDRIYGVELDEDFEPFAGELKEIAFGRQFHHAAKRIPEFILHSRKLDKYIAVKTPVGREVDSFYIPFEQRVKPKKRTGDTSLVLDTRVIFLSVIPDLKKIPVFADIHARTIKSPDLTIEFLTGREAADPEAVGEVKRRVDIMKPRLGGCIVVINPEEGLDLPKAAENIETIAVGFDSSRFQPIVDKLA